VCINRFSVRIEQISSCKNCGARQISTNHFADQIHHSSQNKAEMKINPIFFCITAITIVLFYNIFSYQGEYKMNTKMKNLPSSTNRSRFGDLCVIVRSYPNSEYYLSTLLLSLSHNKKLPQIFVVATETFSEEMLDKYNKHIYGANYIAGINFAQTLPIFNRSLTDYGYEFTDAALDYLLGHNNDLKCKYVLFTNGDNLYSKGIVDAYLDEDMTLGFDMIGFNFISHYKSRHAFLRLHEGDGQREFKLEELNSSNSSSILHLSSYDGSHVPFNAEFAVNRIDLGACVFKVSIFEDNSELRFCKVATKMALADGQLIQEFYRISNKTKIHREFLFVHQ
jgi:hypothetical protein